MDYHCQVYEVNRLVWITKHLNVAGICADKETLTGCRQGPSATVNSMAPDQFPIGSVITSHFIRSTCEENIAGQNQRMRIVTGD